MNDTRLVILKNDLQMLTDSNDTYLNTLISMAERFIKEMGVKLVDGDIEDDGLVSMYAAWLFRKRAESENAMPRMLQYALRNRLMSEKMKVKK